MEFNLKLMPHKYVFMHLFLYHFSVSKAYIFFTPFSPQFRGIQLLVVTILSHRYNSHTGSGETKVKSHASSEIQPHQAALLLNTASFQPGSQPHQCVGGNTVHLATLVSVHCTRPATGVTGATTGQALPNPDNARLIVHRPTDLPVADGCDRAESRVSGGTAGAAVQRP